MTEANIPDDRAAFVLRHGQVIPVDDEHEPTWATVGGLTVAVTSLLRAIDDTLSCIGAACDDYDAENAIFALRGQLDLAEVIISHVQAAQQNLQHLPTSARVVYTVLCDFSDDRSPLLIVVHARDDYAAYALASNHLAGTDLDDAVPVIAFRGDVTGLVSERSQAGVLRQEGL